MSRFHERVNSRRWSMVRRHVFERDGYRCRACGRAGALECDHLVPLHRGGEALAPANLQTLCRACHINKTARENRKHDPARDAWRVLVAELKN